MEGLCKGSNEPPGSLKAIHNLGDLDVGNEQAKMWSLLNQSSGPELSASCVHSHCGKSVLMCHHARTTSVVFADMAHTPASAHPHSLRCISQYLDALEIIRLNWPARSPDLNPIEHLWNRLGRRVRDRNPVPQTLGDLRGALQEEWDNIDQIDIITLIKTMPERMAAVIKARGGHTGY
ncbi:hypothetical protein ANN_09398 [Periplaneta americana]|uniref:Tc1-like transposase DDE domain-containing protein n=1 Tax=Periplaneta americana TaxID=6978 RepID=A0ABQ8TNR4_PERAM|nr:hypothetical protein ANN_09398 [Periplaneta americana]